MNVSELDFELPAELIAQEPAPDRASARLLRLDRRSGDIDHTTISALPGLLQPGDLVVVNNTQVFPARLLGRRVPSGGAVECLLIARAGEASGDASVLWTALVHPGQKLKPGARMVFESLSKTGDALHAEILERHFHGRRLIRLWTESGADVDAAIDSAGHVPLPPYIKRADRQEDRIRYQTIFARQRGSVAAPTAGLHFTPALVAALASAGVHIAEITLHVGYGTFQPVRVERVEDHRVEPEAYEICAAAAGAIRRAHEAGRRVVAVGTTVTRALETVARRQGGRIVEGSGETDLFIHPAEPSGFEFRAIDGLLTNFHLPRSSLLMLVSAFGGRERVLGAYHAAIAERYRFYSYGDAMLIL